MASDFSRTLALLRKEKKISQRIAAGDLEVSQALLSHYENGLREPGLGFVVRAAEYYGVSCDYLLGRSMSRDGAAVSPSRLRDASVDGEDNAGVFALQRKLIINAMVLLFEIAEQTGSSQLSGEMTTYLSLAIYKVFRYLHMADPESVEAAFRTPVSQFDGLCNAQMSLSELRIRAAAQGIGGFGLESEAFRLPSLAPADLARNFPGVSQSMLTLLQAVADAIEPYQDIKRGAARGK